MDTPTIEELRIAASWCSNGEGTQLDQLALQRVSEWLDDLADARELPDEPLNPGCIEPSIKL